MTTQDLAKELDTLARTLRGLTREAAETIEVELELKFARTLQDLTLKKISAAVRTAQSRAGRRASDLRKDVYERRVEKLAQVYGVQLRGLARTDAAPIPGDVLSLRLTGCPQGQTWYGNVIGFYSRSPIVAEVYAWVAAAHNAARILVPGYGAQEIDQAANRLTGATGMPGDMGHRLSDSWRRAEHLNAKIDKWVDEHATLRVRLDDGKIAQVWGIDPAPYQKLIAELAAGNADPIGVFGPAPVSALCS